MRITLLVFLLCLSGAWADPFPDGIVYHGIAMVTNPQGGMDAVRLSDGKTLWSTPDMPALLDTGDAGLYVWRQNRVVRLEMATGRQLALSDRIDTPGWGGFTIDAALQGDKLQADWTAFVPFPQGGAMPAVRHAPQVTGAFTVDATSLRIVSQHRDAETDAAEPHAFPTTPVKIRAVRPFTTDLTLDGRRYHIEVQRSQASQWDSIRYLVCTDLSRGRELYRRRLLDYHMDPPRP